MTMQPDLTRPGAGDAFDNVVSLYADACARDDDWTMTRAGYAFADLHHLVGGDRDALLTMVIEAAAEAVKVAAGMQRPS